MNPPYGDLHLKILKKITEEIIDKNNGKVVSLQPVNMFKDPLWFDKKGSDMEKMQSVLNGRLKNIEPLKQSYTNKIFGIQGHQLAIYELEKGGKFKLESLAQDNLLLKIFEKIKTEERMFNYWECNKSSWKSGIFVPVLEMYGGGISNNRSGFCKDQIIVNGKLNGKIYEKKLSTTAKTLRYPNGIHFNSINEAQNFINSTKTYFIRYLVAKTQVGVHVPLPRLPWMKNYTKPWTDERFFKYFNITKDEQKIIKQIVEN
jgi:hypothetical protein